MAGMDICEKLARAFRRRKYEKVDRSNSFDVKRSSKGHVTRVKIPKAEKGKETVIEEVAELPVFVPKKFTILSSSNDVVDEVWLNQALRRTIAEGRLNVTKYHPGEYQ